MSHFSSTSSPACGPLFQDISDADCIELFGCLGAQERAFSAGETLAVYGSGAPFVGILLEGSASVIRYEVTGLRTILEALDVQSIFGDALSGRGPTAASSAVICRTPCRAVFFDFSRITAPCHRACPRHQKLIENLVLLISRKAFSLSGRVEVLSQRSIREKLLCYFSQLSAQAKSPTFPLPFSITDLADYLSVDRSAMSRELRRLKEEQVIAMDKRLVTLLL